MQSNGGILSARAAAREPVRTILSGPAGGVMGAQYLSELAGFNRIITFDMGGTSTDVSLMQIGHGASLATTSESIVSSLPVAVPMLDIHTVGAGGGSLARFDRAGALRVGPESAGAEPGPICYARGTRPTVTDANLILGRIPTSGLLGGDFALDAQRARDFMDRVRGPMRSVEEFAQGIVDVATSVMEKAVRLISVERGHDPQDYTLVAFGGAGPLHACDLAAALEIPRVLVPCHPGALSALGILRADVTKDFSRTILLRVPDIAGVRLKLQDVFSALEREGRKQMNSEGFEGGTIRIERGLDMRYSGQSYELAVPFAGDFMDAFHHAHEQRYGYSDRSRSCEVVNVRSRFIGRTLKSALPKIESGAASASRAALTKSKVLFAGRRYAATVYDRARFRAGNRIHGPAIVTEYSATTFIPPTWSARVDAYGNIILEPMG
jgi:N-methylhydantoinase A